MSNTLFHNSIGLTGNILAEANKKAYSQAEIILKVFKEYPRVSFTPFDVQKNVKRIYGLNYPITSVRARINLLTERGHLVKSEKAIAHGIYKVQNHVWKLNTGDENRATNS